MTLICTINMKQNLLQQQIDQNVIITNNNGQLKIFNKHSNKSGQPSKILKFTHRCNVTPSSRSSLIEINGDIIS